MPARDRRWIIRLITRDGAWVGTMWYAGDGNGTLRALEAEPWQAFKFDNHTAAAELAQTLRQNGAADQIDVIEWHEPIPAVGDSPAPNQ